MAKRHLLAALAAKKLKVALELVGSFSCHEIVTISLSYLLGFSHQET
jgi:hypothetical protein